MLINLEELEFIVIDDTEFQIASKGEDVAFNCGARDLKGKWSTSQTDG